MPKATITIENPYQGMSKSITASTASAVRRIGGNNRQYAWANAGMTLMRSGYEGHMAPGFLFDALADASTRVNELPLNATITSGSNTQIFVILKNARIVAFDLSDDTVDTTRTAISPAAGTLTNSTNHDIITHKISTGSERVFASYEYNSAGAGDISVCDNAGGTITDAWFSSQTGGSTLSGGVPLKMWIGPESNLYCTNKNLVATYDTVANIANASALNLGINWILTSGVKFGNFSAIVGYRGETAFAGGGTTNYSLGQVRVWFWDGFSPRYNYSYDIPDNLSGAIEVVGDELRVWTSGRSRSTKCWRFNGNGFGQSPLFETGTSTAYLPRHGSVGRFRNHSIFPTYNASNFELMAHGSNDPQVESPGLHSISNNNTDWGFIKELQSNALYVGSAESGSTWSIRKLNETKYATSGIFYSKNYPMPKGSTVEEIRFYFSLFDTGQSLNISGYRNGNSNNDFINQTLTKAELGEDLTHVIKNTILNANSVCLAYQFVTTSSTSGVIIRRIEIDYSYN